MKSHSFLKGTKNQKIIEKMTLRVLEGLKL